MSENNITYNPNPNNEEFNNSIKEVKEKINNENESIKTEEHDIDVVDNKEQSYIDVFTDSIECMSKLNSIKSYGDSFHSQLSELTKNVGIDGKPIEDELVNEIYNQFKLLNKKEEELTDDDVELLLSKFEINEDILKDSVTNYDIKEYKRSILSFILNTCGVDEISKNASKEMENLTAQFKDEMDNLLSELNLNQRLTDLSKAIKEETDETKKKKLQETFNGIYASMSLDIITKKIQNKGIVQLRKECKKNYSKAKEKAFKIMKNDKKNMFLNPTLIEETLKTIYPDQKESDIQLLLYLIFKKINKRNTVDRTTSTFINYFLLTLNKLTTDSFKDQKEDNDLYKSINKFLESIK